MSLTQAIHPRVVGSTVLNALAHAAGLEVGSLFDDSAPPISAKMLEYKGEPLFRKSHQIWSLGNEIGFES